MLTAKTIERCSKLTSSNIEDLIRQYYPDDVVSSSEFVGINDEVFVYNITLPDGVSCPVYVWETYSGFLIADY